MTLRASSSGQRDITPRQVSLESDDRTRERVIGESGDVRECCPAQRCTRPITRRLSFADRWFRAPHEQQVAQIEMDMVIGSCMLIEVQYERPVIRMPDGQSRLLARLTDSRVLRTLSGLDMTSGLQPAPESPMQVKEEHAAMWVEDDS